MPDLISGRLGRIEVAILRELATAGGYRSLITKSDWAGSRSTEQAIGRLEEKGLIERTGSVWFLTEQTKEASNKNGGL